MWRPPSETTSSCSVSVSCFVFLNSGVPLGAFRRPDGGDLQGVGVLALLAKRFLGHELGVAAEQNVGTAAGHVGGDRDHALAAGLGDDECFALVILGVQNLVLDANALEQAGQPLGLLDRDGAHQHRLALFLEGLDLLGGVAELLLLGAVDDVVEFLADHRPVGRDDGDVEIVDFLEFGGFGFRGTGHAGQLLVHAEIILEGDGGERLVLALDLDVFLGFHGLVQTVGPAAAGHQAAGELVDDDDLAVLDDVILVALEQHVGLERLLHVVVPLDVGRVVQVGHIQQLLDLVVRPPR